jgi:hypothetical protein
MLSIFYSDGHLGIPIHIKKRIFCKREFNEYLCTGWDESNDFFFKKIISGSYVKFYPTLFDFWHTQGIHLNRGLLKVYSKVAFMWFKMVWQYVLLSAILDFLSTRQLKTLQVIDPCIERIFMYCEFGRSQVLIFWENPEWAV